LPSKVQGRSRGKGEGWGKSYAEEYKRGVPFFLNLPLMHP